MRCVLASLHLQELLPASTELFDGARLALGQAVQRRLLAPAQGMGSVIQQLIRVMLGTALYLDELCIEGDEQHLLSANSSCEPKVACGCCAGFELGVSSAVASGTPPAQTTHHRQCTRRAST